MDMIVNLGRNAAAPTTPDSGRVAVEKAAKAGEAVSDILPGEFAELLGDLIKSIGDSAVVAIEGVHCGVGAKQPNNSESVKLIELCDNPAEPVDVEPKQKEKEDELGIIESIGLLSPLLALAQPVLESMIQKASDNTLSAGRMMVSAAQAIIPEGEIDKSGVKLLNETKNSEIKEVPDNLQPLPYIDKPKASFSVVETGDEAVPQSVGEERYEVILPDPPDIGSYQPAVVQIPVKTIDDEGMIDQPKIELPSLEEVATLVERHAQAHSVGDRRAISIVKNESEGSVSYQGLNGIGKANVPVGERVPETVTNKPKADQPNQGLFKAQMPVPSMEDRRSLVLKAVNPIVGANTERIGLAAYEAEESKMNIAVSEVKIMPDLSDVVEEVVDVSKTHSDEAGFRSRSDDRSAYLEDDSDEPELVNKEPVKEVAQGIGVYEERISDRVDQTHRVREPETGLPSYVRNNTVHLNNRQNLRRLSELRGSEMTVNIAPPSLGELRVRVEVYNGVVKADVYTDNPASGDLLAKNLNNLRENLVSSGLDVGSLNVSVDQHSGGNNGQRQQRSRMISNFHGIRTDDAELNTFIAPEVREPTNRWFINKVV